jgi:PAS domain S-box-containing protein
MQEPHAVFDCLNLFSSVFQATGVGLSAADHNQKLLWCNPAFASLVGFTPDQLVGRSIAEITSPEDLRVTPDHLRRLADQGGIAEYTKWYVRNDGGKLPVRVTATLLGGGRKQPAVYLAQSQVIESLSSREILEALHTELGILTSGAEVLYSTANDPSQRVIAGMVRQSAQKTAGLFSRMMLERSFC